jgi:hypothetical protein
MADLIIILFITELKAQAILFDHIIHGKLESTKASPQANSRGQRYRNEASIEGFGSGCQEGVKGGSRISEKSERGSEEEQ